MCVSKLMKEVEVIVELRSFIKINGSKYRTPKHRIRQNLVFDVQMAFSQPSHVIRQIHLNTKHSTTRRILIISYGIWIPIVLYVKDLWSLGQTTERTLTFGFWFELDQAKTYFLQI